MSNGLIELATDMIFIGSETSIDRDGDGVVLYHGEGLDRVSVNLSRESVDRLLEFVAAQRMSLEPVEEIIRMLDGRLPPEVLRIADEEGEKWLKKKEREERDDRS